MTIFKVLGENGQAFHGGSGKWSLPTADGPGEWMPVIEDELVPCKNGYHLCRKQDLLQWLGPTLYEAEYRGEMVVADDKIVVREARLLRKLDTWNERTARLFACDCAERVVRLTNDERCVGAIAVARRYANGEATSEELAAAWAAARNAAVAWAAARNAAGAVAWAAAWAAAETAAGAVAWAAAWAATGAAAGNAAWAAAGAAAGNAAWAAAWDAEQEWQTARLMEYLQGDVGTTT